jgi:multidrug resistance efflux pump
LRSFTYVVTPYVPLRPTTATKAADTTKKQTNTQQQGGTGGNRGGGRGGRGGGRGGMMMEEEKPGSTRIVTILPDGSRVKAGEVVCELDKSAYEDEEKAQLIRYLQAKSYVEQAKAIQEVNEITLGEYRDGIYPQDMQLIRQYIQTCQIEKDRAERNLAWSLAMEKQGFRTPFQVQGDRLALQQSEIALAEAKGMLERLSRYTGPKIIKSLEANVAAIRADRLMQEAAFSLEQQRLERIRKNIANCTVRAPREGIVVYANQTNNWGMVEAQIDQGVTLREDQPIFNLPDPLHMRVRARINESKVAMIRMGQPVIILVDAFPDRPLKGVVAEVVPISVPIRGSDVRIYYANVDITEGFEALKPGLSAEIIVEIESRHDVTRVPIESIRWVNDRPYVALYDRAGADAGRQAWLWQPIEIGLSDPDHAEVLNGLKPGDRVVARPGNLPPPAPEVIKKSSTTVAALP